MPNLYTRSFSSHKNPVKRVIISNVMFEAHRPEVTFPYGTTSKWLAVLLCLHS